jgi:molybdopterin molybdotransferase
MSDAPRKHLSAAEAARAILAEVAPLPAHSAQLGEALGQVLAQRVVSPLDIPPWDNSAMDGYALRSADLSEGGETVLEVVEEIAAGAFPLRTVGQGQCARIFTGAPVPEGADCVIRQEDTAALKDGRVQITGSRDAGRNVRRQGEDIERGAVVFEPGTELSPSRIGVLASMAMAHVEVHRRPTVAILSTGDEIADLDEREAILTGRKIASSNSYGMRAALEQAGGVLLDLGIARDDPEDLEQRLDKAADADLLVSSGGMSVGEHDHLREMLELRGGDMKFWRLRTRPGAPVGFGLMNGVPWIGLPGNPVSTMVTFELFVRPAIRRLLGHTKPFRRAVSVRVEERLETRAPLTHFLRAQVSESAGTLAARLTGPQGSGMLSSMASADALLIVPEDMDEVTPGETVQAILLGESVHVEDPPYE